MAPAVLFFCGCAALLLTLFDLERLVLASLQLDAVAEGRFSVFSPSEDKTLATLEVAFGTGGRAFLTGIGFDLALLPEPASLVSLSSDATLPRLSTDMARPRLTVLLDRS